MPKSNARAPQQTPWASGGFGGHGRKPKLLFGRMYEDAAVEQGAFAPGSRVFSIASAGCTALALAANHRVTAVDINPAQCAYVRARAAGQPAVAGGAERLLAAGRALLKPCGWRRARLREFLQLDDPAAQIDYWRRHLNTRRFRAATDLLFSLTWLGLVYAAPLLASLPRHFGRVMRARMARCFARHPNSGNPYARALLLGAEQAPGTAERTAGAAAPAAHEQAVQVHCADAADYLEQCPPGSFAGFTLSNILDGASVAYRQRLLAAVRHAASAEAVAVLRSFAEPATNTPYNVAAQDRSILWGIVDVRPVSELAARPGSWN